MYCNSSIKDWIDFRINSNLEFNIAFNYKELPKQIEEFTLADLE
ncbi:MAG: hypothetical protein V3U92_16600 [Cellulophaga sp.]